MSISGKHIISARVTIQAALQTWASPPQHEHQQHQQQHIDHSDILYATDKTRVCKYYISLTSAESPSSSLPLFPPSLTCLAPLVSSRLPGSQPSSSPEPQLPPSVLHLSLSGSSSAAVPALTSSAWLCSLDSLWLPSGSSVGRKTQLQYCHVVIYTVTSKCHSIS